MKFTQQFVYLGGFALVVVLAVSGAADDSDLKRQSRAARINSRRYPSNADDDDETDAANEYPRSDHRSHQDTFDYVEQEMERKPCNRRIRIKNGRKRLLNGNNVVIYRCFKGYSLFGPQTAVCNDGEWSSDPPVCVRRGCSRLTPPSEVTMELARGGAIARFRCLYPDAMLIGSDTLVCDGQKWNGTTPYCYLRRWPHEFSTTTIPLPFANTDEENQGTASFLSVDDHKVEESDGTLSPQQSDLGSTEPIPGIYEAVSTYAPDKGQATRRENVDISPIFNELTPSEVTEGYYESKDSDSRVTMETSGDSIYYDPSDFSTPGGAEPTVEINAIPDVSTWFSRIPIESSSQPVTATTPTTIKPPVVSEGQLLHPVQTKLTSHDPETTDVIADGIRITNSLSESNFNPGISPIKTTPITTATPRSTSTPPPRRAPWKPTRRTTRRPPSRFLKTTPRNRNGYPNGYPRCTVETTASGRRYWQCLTPATTTSTPSTSTTRRAETAIDESMDFNELYPWLRGNSWGRRKRRTTTTIAPRKTYTSVRRTGMSTTVSPWPFSVTTSTSSTSQVTDPKSRPDFTTQIVSLATKISTPGTTLATSSRTTTVSTNSAFVLSNQTQTKTEFISPIHWQKIAADNSAKPGIQKSSVPLIELVGGALFALIVLLLVVLVAKRYWRQNVGIARKSTIELDCKRLSSENGDVDDEFVYVSGLPVSK